MPVRSLNSSVLKWPDKQTVDQSVHQWANEIAQTRRDVLRIGYFGSYSRGDWGVGSDLDLIVIVDKTETPFERRAAEWELMALPVPTDIQVYSQKEWAAFPKKGKFSQTLANEVKWLFVRKE